MWVKNEQSKKNYIIITTKGRTDKNGGNGVPMMANLRKVLTDAVQLTISKGRGLVVLVQQ